MSAIIGMICLLGLVAVLVHLVDVRPKVDEVSGGAGSGNCRTVAEYRINDLAQVSGVSVRNIRVYQDRGLLPPRSSRGGPAGTTTST